MEQLTVLKGGKIYPQFCWMWCDHCTVNIVSLASNIYSTGITHFVSLTTWYILTEVLSSFLFNFFSILFFSDCCFLKLKWKCDELLGENWRSSTFLFSLFAVICWTQEQLFGGGVGQAWNVITVQIRIQNCRIFLKRERQQYHSSNHCWEEAAVSRSFSISINSGRVSTSVITRFILMGFSTLDSLFSSWWQKKSSAKRKMAYSVLMIICLLTISVGWGDREIRK